MTYDKLINTLINSAAQVATYYQSDKRVKRATRRLYGKNRKPDRYHIEVQLTEGPPNYRERQFIKTAKKAGETFPIRKIQLKFPPVRR
jgi:hypothetical protein